MTKNSIYTRRSNLEGMAIDARTRTQADRLEFYTSIGEEIANLLNLTMKLNEFIPNITEVRIYQNVDSNVQFLFHKEYRFH